jgi:hypothetical protein
VKLKKSMEGYDKVVLLKHDHTDSWLDWSEADEELADVVAAPTYANLAKYLKELKAQGYYIDLWILTHGKSGKGFLASTGSFGSEDWVSESEIRNLLALTGYNSLPLRMVYSWACFGKELTDDFVYIGAKVANGARYVNFYPTQFGKFADEWNKDNVAFASCIDNSNTATTRTLVQSAIALKGAIGWCWGLNGTSVLGNGACAKDFFLAKYLDEDEWVDSMSGKENMNYSSEMSTAGTGSITKSSKPSWWIAP